MVLVGPEEGFKIIKHFPHLKHSWNCRIYHWTNLTIFLCPSIKNLLRRKFQDKVSGNYLKLRVHERIYANNGSIPTVAMELLSKELLTFQKLLQLPNLHPNLRLQLFVLIKKKNNASNTSLWKSWWRFGD